MAEPVLPTPLSTAPTSADPNAIVLKIGMDLDTAGAWRQRVSRAQALREKAKTEFHWQDNIAAYSGKPLTKAPSEDWINVNKDYAVIRQKSSQLFYRTPEVQLTPLEPMIGREAGVQLFQAVLNSKLGVRDLYVKRMVDQAIFNALCVTLGPTKIGYENRTVPVEVPLMDPANIPAGMPPEQIPQGTQKVDVPVVERWYWDAFSPDRLLLPHGFTGNDYDAAAWVGMEFWKDVADAKREYQLAEDFEGTAVAPPTLIGDGESSATDPQVHGYEIWYRASVFDPTVPNWERIRLLVLLDGIELPVRHEDSPFQAVDTQGRLTPNSMRGYPIHPLCLNFITDVVFPPSDAAMIRPLVNELCKGRTQMIQQRDRSLPMRWFDKGRIGGEEGLNALLKNIMQGWIGFENVDTAHLPFGEVPQARFPRENFTFNQVVDHDLVQTLAMGGPQRGATEDTSRTATELRVMQSNIDVRLSAERQIVIDWFVRGVEKLAALVQKFADKEDYVQVIGADGSQSIQAWTSANIQGRFAFTIRPDSSIYVDAGDYRRQLLEAYNYLARDPQVNRAELLGDLIRAFNMDPTKVIQQKPPEKKPDPPNITYRFGGDDLNPQLPQFPIVVEILRLAGVEIPVEAIQRAQIQAAQTPIQATAPGGAPGTASARPGIAPPHPGMAEKAEVLNRHQDERTGAVQGVGRLNAEV